MKPATPERRKHSLGLMLVSLLTATFLWAYVQDLRSTTSREDGRVLDVRGLGEDYVALPKKADMDKVEVVFTGSEEELRKITGDKVRPFIDLTGRDIGKHSVRVQLDRRLIPFNVQYTLRPAVTDVTIEPLVRRPKPVLVQGVGQVPAGFLVVKLEAVPNTIQVSGARVDVDKVQSARAFYDYSKAREGPQELGVDLVDNKGQVVPDVEADRTTVVVNATVVAAPSTKALPVQPTWAGQLPLGYRLARYEVNPQQIRVSAESSLLANLVTLDTETINLTGRRATTTVRTKVRFPKGVVAVGGDTVSVKVYIEPAPLPKEQQPPP